MAALRRSDVVNEYQQINFRFGLRDVKSYSCYSAFVYTLYIFTTSVFLSWESTCTRVAELSVSHSQLAGLDIDVHDSYIVNMHVERLFCSAEKIYTLASFQLDTVGHDCVWCNCNI